MATDFWAKFPEYGNTTAVFDRLRKQQYPQLDEQRHVYLDYAGSGLSAQAQTQAHSERMRSQIAGNPHSISPASDMSNSYMQSTRKRVLEFLNASPKEYAVIFTANATGAARLVGEGYCFARHSKLVLTADNHNSINGLRCFSGRGHGKTTYIPVTSEDLRLDTAAVEEALSPKVGCWSRRRTPQGLFAYPAQSNFSGVRHPLSWIELAHQQGFDVLLDAAAYVPLAPLDLSAIHPDFVILSWYKVFGFPTGMGCLVAKKLALDKLQRPWFSGGTVDGVMVNESWHAMTEGEAKFEDGTVNFLSIPDVLFGLNWFCNLDLTGLAVRLRCLSGWLIERLKSLRHGNGLALVKLYGPLSNHDRGATVTFNLVDKDATMIDERLIGVEAAASKISIRVGCFCNPGANEAARRIDRQALKTLSKTSRERFEDIHRSLGRPLAGAVRVSLGTASNLADVEAFLNFVETTYKDRAVREVENLEKLTAEV